MDVIADKLVHSAIHLKLESTRVNREVLGTR